MANDDDSRNGIIPVLTSLAGIPGARSQTRERVQFDVSSVEAALESIRRLQGTGALTIHFHAGKPNGTAEWETTRKP